MTQVTYDVRLFLIKRGGGQACGLAFRTPVSHIRVLGLSLAFAPDSRFQLMCPFGVSDDSSGLVPATHTGGMY